MKRIACLFFLYCHCAVAGELGRTSMEQVHIRVVKAVEVTVRKTEGLTCINAGMYQIDSKLPLCSTSSQNPNVVINTNATDGVIMLTVIAV